MEAEKSTIIDGHLLEQFWWAGKYVTYIDHHTTEETYQEAWDRLTRRNKIITDDQVVEAINNILKILQPIKDDYEKKLKEKELERHKQ